MSKKPRTATRTVKLQPLTVVERTSLDHPRAHHLEEAGLDRLTRDVTALIHLVQTTTAGYLNFLTLTSF